VAADAIDLETKLAHATTAEIFHTPDLHLHNAAAAAVVVDDDVDVVVDDVDVEIVAGTAAVAAAGTVVRAALLGAGEAVVGKKTCS
jgi:tRNA U34 5-carboxymethylaminomethyl modifying enzyme MnmG/GidA